MKKRKHWSRNDRRVIHHLIVRKKVFGTASRPRLSIFFSHQWATCQIINDDLQQTIVGASVRGKNIATVVTLADKICTKIEQTKQLGTTFYFDRSGYRFCGRVKAFADQFKKHKLTI